MLVKIIGFIVGLLGVAAVSYGAYLFSEPFGFIIAGAFALLFSFLSSRAAEARGQ